MYMLTINHRSTPYSNSAIAAAKMTLTYKEDVSGQRFIDILERMEDGEMVIKISVESKIEFGRNWVVSIGYYDAAGERKGIFNCDLEYIAGQEAIEASFSGVPNCADHLKYYRVISIEDRK